MLQEQKNGTLGIDIRAPWKTVFGFWEISFFRDIVRGKGKNEKCHMDQ